VNVLSLFNGMNTCRLALENIGIEVDRYYSSEIKSYAIELTQHHHPDTIQLGDITEWKNWDIDWGSINLVTSGSPCQDLSIAGASKRQGLKGSRSSLFYVFVDILKKIRQHNPNVLFFQENVASASKDDVNAISQALGIIPVKINSSLLTAQLRNRYYWSNIKTREDLTGQLYTDILQPKDQGILLKNIIESGKVTRDKSPVILERYGWSCSYRDKRSEKAQRYLKTRSEKSFITAVQEDGYLRQFSKVELCRLQGFQDNHCDTLEYNQAARVLGGGWTLPVIEHFFKNIK